MRGVIAGFFTERLFRACRESCHFISLQHIALTELDAAFLKIPIKIVRSSIKRALFFALFIPDTYQAIIILGL